MAQKTYTPEEWELYMMEQLGPRPEEYIRPIPIPFLNKFIVNGELVDIPPGTKGPIKNPAFDEWNMRKAALEAVYQASGGTFDTENMPDGKGGLAGATSGLIPTAVNAIAQGGNTAIFNQKENEGSFASSGEQSVQTEQQATANQQTNQTQTSSEASNAVGSLTGSTAQIGETSTSVQDTLGLGALLGRQGQQQAAADAVRNQFLTGTIQSGTGQLQRNVGDAVAQALSGPGMINAGEGARARAVGAAAQAVARDEFNNQLAASGQLNQLSGLGQLAQVGQGYTGQTQQATNFANTQQDTTQQNVSQGLNSLMGNTITNQSQTGTQNTQSSQSGTSNVSSTGIGFGEQPVQQGGGGSFICAICAKHDYLPSSLIKQVAEKVKANKNFYKKQILGYYYWSQPIAKLLLKLPLLCGFVAPFAEQICKGFLEETPTKTQKFLLSVFNYLNSLGFLLSKGKSPNIDPKLLEVVKEFYEPLTFE